MFFSRRFWACGKEKTKACLARVEGPGRDTSSCAPVLTGAPCQSGTIVTSEAQGLCPWGSSARCHLSHVPAGGNRWWSGSSFFFHSNLNIAAVLGSQLLFLVVHGSE